MVYFGKIKNGRIELDQPVRLPEGSRVRIEAIPAPKPEVNPENDPAYSIAELATDCGPADFAAEHDHYIHGTPKRGLKP